MAAQHASQRYYSGKVYSSGTAVQPMDIFTGPGAAGTGSQATGGREDVWKINMCDFHSIVCYVDGAIFHVPSNSHSEAVRVSGRPDNSWETRFVECEWGAWGRYPGAYGTLQNERKINEKQRRAIDAHYLGLKKVMKSGQFTGKWARPEYADVRLEWLIVRRPRSNSQVLAKMAQDNSVAVRRLVVECLPKGSPALAAMAVDQDIIVRQWVANRLPPDSPALAGMIRDNDSNVRWIIAQRLPQKSKALAKMAEDNNYIVLYAVAGRLPRNSPALAKLTYHADATVRMLARQRIGKNGG